ncbi:peptidoglycan-recognition protein LE-like [Phymastichus coffea]|uniref:peptidoglycan-recognition protein LE-like n=1 Tax=Phymastichus coffea TaxID=108790 RepID=UPI00273CB9BD|nr:peptidoglycan-recognition protein LE-like [Phymastichus coffea]
MTIEQHRRHHPQSDESSEGEAICLSDNITAYSMTNNNTIEETAVIHCQPANQGIVEVDSDDYEDSSSSDNHDDENKQNWVAERSQYNIENKVSNSKKTTITNNHKTVIQAPSVIINKKFYTTSPLAPLGNLDRIDTAPSTEKNTIDNNPDTNVEPKLSVPPLQPLCTQDKDTKWYTKQRHIIICWAVLAGLTFIGIIVYFFIPGSCAVCIVSRENWGAQSAKEKAKPLAVLPAKYVIIIHTRTVNCFTKAHCSNIVREIQKYNMELNKTDIVYNWLVGGDGCVYQCRGWDVEGDHTKNYDNKSIGVGFFGTFKQEEPSKDQIEMGKKLIKQGVEQNNISKDYILVGQKQCLQTPSESPGEKLYEIIKKWDNWSPACIPL